MKLIKELGNYIIFLRKVFRKPERWSEYRKLTMLEIDNIGWDSMGIVSIVSIFVGAVVTVQTAWNMENPLLPSYLIGLATRDSIIAEFSPTMISLILAGKVGSNIASGLGTMRVTEQIDALEVMGVNSATLLVLPKIIAAIVIIPLLIIMSMALGITGGWAAGVATGMCPTTEFIYGLQYEFRPFYMFYAIFKTFIFAFIIVSVSAYRGYFTVGGALEVGKASTKAVVHSSVLIIFINYVLTQLLLT
ncbi:MAG: phospholipid/cholesterol/gamma-HCH transport system permease protein [Flavobacteriales bacterium]|jgi:phospholipid/cholesterol/gamma-HCH transport system permease protein